MVVPSPRVNCHTNARCFSLSLSLSNAAPTSAVRSRARTSCGPLSTTHNLEGSPRRFSQVARATVIHRGHPSSRDTPGKAPSTIPRSRATLRANESRSLLYFFTSVSPTFLASPLRCFFSLCPSLSRSRALSLYLSSTRTFRPLFSYVAISFSSTARDRVTFVITSSDGAQRRGRPRACVRYRAIEPIVLSTVLPPSLYHR